MSLATELVRLSRFAGERFDLVQAGGGNTSVKDEKTMLVKASGLILSEISPNRGYCEIDIKPLAAELPNLFSRGQDLSHAERDAEAEKLVKQFNKTSGGKPSIEALLHVILGPVTLHVHPIAVTSRMCRSEWYKLADLFEGAIFVDYRTPGYDLACALRNAVFEANWEPGKACVVFLRNHGLIISHRDVDSVMSLTDEIVSKVESDSGLDFSRYRLTNALSDLYRQAFPDEQVVSYLCEDVIMFEGLTHSIQSFSIPASLPDQLVYCGVWPVQLLSIFDPQPLVQYHAKFGKLPRTVIYQGSLFLVGPSTRKCREAEEVLKAHFLSVTCGNGGEVVPLVADEIEYLLNWDAEKHRQSV